MSKTTLRSQIIATLLLAACAGLLLYATATAARDYATATRGISDGPIPGLAVPPGLPYGVNVRLHEEATAEARRRLLAIARQGGYGWVRQEFPWAQIEPERGRYDWATWDNIVTLAEEQGLQIIAVLDTSPAWARSNPIATSPPDHDADYARFVGDLVARYRGRVAAYQIWDQPNIAPYWGPRYASPPEYTRLLLAASQAVKAADPQAMVLAGGLAPTNSQTERDQSDVTFLQGMYKAGARGSFDVLAAKPYGFWSGPDDRRVDANVLNFSRAILLREVMERHGDGNKAIWAVEMGWNALPPGWQGRPSPWGADDEARQAGRTAQAIQRARSEWGWLPVLILPALRYPAAAADDPVRGFALLNDDLSPRQTFQAARESGNQGIRESGGELRGRFLVTLGLLLAALVLVTWRLLRLAVQLPWQEWATRFLSWPEGIQLATMGLALAIFYFAPWLPLSLTAIVVLLALLYLRLDFGLLLAVFSIPFYQHPKQLFGSWEFSLLEVLILACTAIWLVRQAQSLTRSATLRHQGGDHKGSPLRLTGLDWAILFFLALSLVSLAASADVRLSLRELRTVIVEPILLYFLVTRSAAGTPIRKPQSAIVCRLALALLAGGVAASLLGLYQYVFTSQVITAEDGLRRMLGPYPSPNALGLFLERVLPLALALGLVACLPPRREGREGFTSSWRLGRETALRFTLYVLPIALLSLALLLTFSVGAWAGAAVGCALVVIRQPRRVALGLIGVAVVAGLLALPLLRTERVASHLDLQSVTTSAVRLAVWQSATDMIRDHPVQGVGLDGFLELYRTRYIRPEAWREPDLSHPHNLLLESWLSLGILGPLALLWLLGAFFWRAHLCHKASNAGGDTLAAALAVGLTAGMAAGVAHGLVDRFLAGAPDLSAVFFLTLATVALLPGKDKEK